MRLQIYLAISKMSSAPLNMLAVCGARLQVQADVRRRTRCASCSCEVKARVGVTALGTEVWMPGNVSIGCGAAWQVLPLALTVCMRGLLMAEMPVQSSMLVWYSYGLWLQHSVLYPGCDHIVGVIRILAIPEHQANNSTVTHALLGGCHLT